MQKSNEEKSLSKVNINWYPGHMAKTRRQIVEDLKLVDVVIEILDSRIPISSQNPDIAKFTKDKDKIVVLNKSDLADKIENDLWVNHFREKGVVAVLADCNLGKGIDEVLREVEKLRAMVLRNSKCW